MLHNQLPGRIVVWMGACGLAVALGAAPAHSEPAQVKAGADNACMSAYKSAQEREQAGRVVEASQFLKMCSSESCGSDLWKECATRYSELYDKVPSVVPVVTDNQGQPRVDVQVKVDGRLLTSRLDGRALLVDPGTHEFSFSADGGVFATASVALQAGQRNHLIAVSMNGMKRDRKASNAKN